MYVTSTVSILFLFLVARRSESKPSPLAKLKVAFENLDQQEIRPQALIEIAAWSDAMQSMRGSLLSCFY